jgi:hypothetical protein
MDAAALAKDSAWGWLHNTVRPNRKKFLSPVAKALSSRQLRPIHPGFRVLFPNQVLPVGDLARAVVE